MSDPLGDSVAAGTGDGDQLGASTAPSGVQKTVDEWLKEGKIVIFFKSAGGPKMTRRKFKFRIEAPWSEVVTYLRKLLQFDATQSLFLFVNSAFQPSPDMPIGDIFRCFSNEGILVVSYAIVAAWG